MNNISRKVSMLCPICGNDQFSAPDLGDMELLEDADGNAKVQCSDCKHIFTKDELIEENRELINNNIDEVANEAISEIKKEFERCFFPLNVKNIGKCHFFMPAGPL